MVNVSSSDAVRALDTGQNYRPLGYLQVKFGSQVGLGARLPGDPGGPGGPPGPDPDSVPYPAPAVGTGWEVRVLAAPSYNILLAIMPSQVVSTIAFVKQLKDAGSGTVTVNLDDPFWDDVTLPNAQPAHYLLDYEHLWQIIQDGVIRFEFLGETVTEQLADSNEQRIATVTGPGSAAALKWAMAAPPGFPDNVKYKLDAISDSFSAVDVNGNFVIDYDLWNASAQTADISVNPSGSARLMGHPSSGGGATILGSTAYDATETLVSAQVSPIVSPDASGAALDGSQVTQFYIQSLDNAAYYALFGLSATEFYCQFGGPSGTYTKTICSAAAFNTAMQGTNAYQYWQISEEIGDDGPTGWGTFHFWTSSDAQNWKEQYSIRHNWDATNCGLYFLAQYSVDNKQPAIITSLNSNITTSSLAGPLYYNQPIMAVWTDLLAKAKARGTVPFMTTGPLSAATDSFGNVWTDSQSVQIQNGTDLLSLLQAHVSMINADWVVQPGFRVQVGLPVTGKITLGFDRSNQVVFRDGSDCSARVRSRVRNQVQNLLGVINQDGRTLVAENTSSEAIYGQREAWLQAAMQVSLADLAVVATAADLEKANEVLSYTLSVSPYLPGRCIFTGFDVGDWVGLERPDFSAIDKVRVVAIAVQVSSDGAEAHEVTLSTYIQWLAEQLDYIQTKMGGGFLSAAGTSAIPNNAQLTNRNTPTIAKPTLPGLAGVQAGGPNAGAPLVYDPNTGNWVPAGTIFTDTGGAANVIIQGEGSQVVLAGQGLTVQNTPQAPADGPGSPATPTAEGQVIEVGSTTITDADGTTRVVIGVQSDGSYGATAAGAPAPSAPDAPTVTGTLNGILVTWDGLLTGTNPKADFLWTEVHVSTSSGFTPATDTLKGTLVSAAVFPVTGLVVGTTYYVKLVARNTSGTASAASTQQTGVPTGLTASTVGQLGVLNANPYFAGGDGTTWAAYNGTFSVSTSPPSGTPYPNAGFFTVTSSGGALEESGQPFRVAGSQKYYVTAWVYSSDTTCVIGFDWQDSGHSYLSTSTETFAVTASTWTLVTTVQTSHASAVWAYPRVSPANTVGHTIYVTGVLCLQQVPGGLIQTGTITAAQIASHTITAAEIASHTITAAEITADTITAAEIAGGTITASEIATGTITAGLLAAGIVKAGIVDGTSISAATFIAYGANGNLLIYTGTPASGNLLCVISPATGSDSYSNSWEQGVTLTALADVTNMLTIRDTSGNTMAGIDATGNVSGNVINATSDLQVGGQSVLGLVGPPALGIVNYGYKAIGGTAWPSTAITSEVALFELDQVCTAGRVYEFYMHETIINTGGGAGSMHLHLRYTIDGSTPSTSSSEAHTVASRVENTGTDAHIGPLGCIFGPYGSDTTLKCLVTGHAGANNFQFKNDPYIRIEIRDLGSTLPSGTNNLTVLGTGTGGGSSPQTYTEYFYPTHTWSYYYNSGSPTLRGQDISMYHGYYGDANNWQFAYIQWSSGSLGHNLNTVLNYTVNWVHNRFTNLHSWYSSGMTFGIHSSTSLGSASYSTMLTSMFISEGNTYDYSWGNWSNFAAGGTTYMVLAPDAGHQTSYSWYGYFYGKGADTSREPRMAVNFTN